MSPILNDSVGFLVAQLQTVGAAVKLNTAAIQAAAIHVLAPLAGTENSFRHIDFGLRLRSTSGWAHCGSRRLSLCQNCLQAHWGRKTAGASQQVIFTHIKDDIIVISCINATASISISICIINATAHSANER